MQLTHWRIKKISSAKADIYAMQKEMRCWTKCWTLDLFSFVRTATSQTSACSYALTLSRSVSCRFSLHLVIRFAKVNRTNEEHKFENTVGDQTFCYLYTFSWELEANQKKLLVNERKHSIFIKVIIYLKIPHKYFQFGEEEEQLWRNK